MAASTALRDIPVLLLKTRSHPNDGYEEFFSNVGNGRFQPKFVPVLEHTFSDESFRYIKALIETGSLVPTKQQGPGKSFGALLFTSQRAVEFFAKIIDEIRASGRDVNELLPASIPIYTVGPATARALRALGLECPVLGEDTGNGATLAPYMIEDYNRRAQGSLKAPMLFLVGETRGDIIPRTLRDEKLDPDRRCELEEVVVYATKEMEPFHSEFSTICREQSANGVGMQWVIVFSPTGCQAMLDGLGLLDASGKVSAETISKVTATSGMKTFVASIGPTTRDYLRKEFDFDPHVSAPMPSPEGVGDAIMAYMQEHNLLGA